MRHLPHPHHHKELLMPDLTFDRFKAIVADQLGVDRWLPDTREGDVILIANCGAYGYAMSSNYNRRAPAREFII